jgi:hypothetical protein
MPAVSASDQHFGYLSKPQGAWPDEGMGSPRRMFVVIQFPIADGRAFTSASGQVDRPDWRAPNIPGLLAHRDFVRGFGRLAYRRAETNAAWIDEDFFAYAKRAVKFPTLDKRDIEDRGKRWTVNCRFRRLLSDGEAVVRLEFGFSVVEGWPLASPHDVVRRLLGLPTIVPGGWADGTTKDLVLLGPYIAQRYARATTRNGQEPAALVAAGDPIVVVQTTRILDATPVKGAVAAGNEAENRQPVFLATTRTPHGSIKTWYVDTADGGSAERNLRMALLRQHVQEEALDKILQWAVTGALTYMPNSPDGDRLDKYINDATKIINRNSYYGVDNKPLRDALDAATSTQRAAVEVRRRERLDGMRRQVREKAERFLAEREAQKPLLNIYGGMVMGDQNINTFSGTFTNSSVAGTIYAKTMEGSFNSFAAQKPNDDLKSAVERLYAQVGDLVGKLKEESPEEAEEVAGTLSTITEEVGKDKPNKTILKSLGNGIVEVAKKFSELAGPVSTAVLAVLKIFGIAAL